MRTCSGLCLPGALTAAVAAAVGPLQARVIPRLSGVMGVGVAAS